MVEQAPLFRAVVADAGEAGLFDDDVRPARYTVDLTRMPHHRLQGRAFLGAQKSTAKHGQRRIYPRTDRKDFLGFPERQSITKPGL